MTMSTMTTTKMTTTGGGCNDLGPHGELQQLASDLVDEEFFDSAPNFGVIVPSQVDRRLFGADCLGRRNMSNRNVSGRNVSDRIMSARNTSDRNMSDRNVSE